MAGAGRTLLSALAWIALGNLVCGGTMRRTGFADVFPAPRRKSGIAASCLACCSAGRTRKLVSGEGGDDSVGEMVMDERQLQRRDYLSIAGRGTALLSAALLAGTAAPSHANEKGGRQEEASGKQGLRGRGAKGYREVRDESVGYSIMLPPLIRVARDEARDRRHNLLLAYKGVPGLTIEVESRIMPFDFPGLLDIDTVQIGVLRGPGADRNETKLRRREVRTVGSVKAYLWEFENVTSGDITRSLISSVEREGRTWLTFMSATSPQATLEDYYVQREICGVFDSFLLFTSQKPYGQRRNFGLSDTSLRFFNADKRYADEELEVSELRKAGRLILVGKEGTKRRSEAAYSARDTRTDQPSASMIPAGPDGAGTNADNGGGESDAVPGSRSDPPMPAGANDPGDGTGEGATSTGTSIPEDGSIDDI